ncbi:MAG: type I-E CRISPR-associated protein Cas5/CasD [Alphaproteobacteria bacterium]|nr:type I-E CRISPR-associated protein Cas5/CasD [Alphaproteobacteria bacterium]
MGEALIFTLAAPLASFGAVAVGERRPTWDRPGKSQVIGLLGCACGIERTDVPRQADIAEGLRLAIRVDDPGAVVTD